MNDLARQMRGIQEAVAASIQAVLDSGWWIGGEATRAFEREFADYCGAAHCVGVGNGTDGLEVALRAIGASGREVITVANAGMYTTTACRIVDAIPVYVDVEPDQLLIDPGVIAAATTPQTSAVVATHLFGNVVDIDLIREALAGIGREDVRIVEDASQAHGAACRGKRVGSKGDIAVFSFYPTKNLGAVGDAGAILCQDRETYDTITALHQYGWTARYQSSIPYGRNSRIDDIQAAVLSAKLPHLEDWNEVRRSIVQRYAEAVHDSDVHVVTDYESGGAAHLAVLRSRDRDRLRSLFDSAGIDTDVHYPTLDPNQLSQQGLPMRRCDLSVTTRAADEIVSVPCFPGMLDREVDLVADRLASFSSQPQ